MKILGLSKSDASIEAGVPPSPELMDKMGQLVEEASKAGVLLSTDGLTPSSKGKRVRLANGKVTVTDGPFTESNELVASYALLQVKTMEEAVEWTTRFLKVVGEGECELRPILEPEDFAAQANAAQGAKGAHAHTRVSGEE